jgi:D-glycero-D-manno-heptose 1,7-bisphosphate phosphatase
MRAVFLDRDGVINRKAPNGEYIVNWPQVEILPGSVEAAATLGRAGYLIFIVTNQRGLATGKIREADLAEIHSKLREVFLKAGVSIADVYHCSHDLQAQCSCRKPKAGMLYQAAREHHLKLADCWMVGDSVSDIQAGMVAGCKTVWITDCPIDKRCEAKPDVQADTLQAAVTRILELDTNCQDVEPDRVRN